VERKLGHSGYQSKYQGLGQYQVTFHTKSTYVSLFLGPEEYDQLIQDLEEVKNAKPRSN
jgi:hypothetical protein